jgi:hypothetical protein
VISDGRQGIGFVFRNQDYETIQALCGLVFQRTLFSHDFFSSCVSSIEWIVAFSEESRQSILEVPEYQIIKTARFLQ